MSRVLVARLDSVGDVLLAGPAVRAVANGRRSDGGSPNDVVVLCGPQGKSAASLLPEVADVFAWDSPWISNPAPRLTGPHADAMVSFVRNSRITEAVILTSFHQSPLPLALLLRLAGVERITGASTDYAGSLLDVRLRPGEDFPEDQPEAVRALRHRPGGRLPTSRRATTAGSWCKDPPDVRHLVGEAPTWWSTRARPSRPGPGRRCIMRRPWNCSRAPATGWW